VKDAAGSLLDDLMDMNDPSEPRMPRVEDLKLLGLMGVISSLCTTMNDSIRALVTARRGKSIRKACGYVDDRLCRPAPLPPLPEPARKAGKYSPSPTYPQAPQPTQDLILMK
jgi:hypothetical protein